VRRHLARRKLVARNRPFAAEERVDGELVGRCGLGGVLEGHGSPSSGSAKVLQGCGSPCIVHSVRRGPRRAWCTAPNRRRRKEGTMWWGVGILGFILYITILFTLGLMTLRKGHGWLFVFGIFFPILWLIGAVMRPAEPNPNAV